MSKLHQIIKNSINNIYWVESVGTYKCNSDFPSNFEQRFGNISTASITIKEYLIDRRKIDKLHDFLQNNGFDITQQYNLNEYKEGYYYNNDKLIMINASFGVPEEHLEKDDEGDLVSNGRESLSVVISPVIYNKDWIIKFINELIDLNLFFIPNVEKSFFVIAEGRHGLYKQKTSFKNMEIKDNRYDIYYGDNFPHEKFRKFVKEETENLLLLHGDPGTGKSNYIKNLITEAEEDVIYIPPSMVSVISSPGFVAFMLQNKNNILLIEDAEEILSIDRNSATNNLLGLTDGFLKDALNLKIICTFNCDLKRIDPALLRKGRLYFEYKFDKLTKEESQRLADFCDLNIEVTGDMTLAEIFNHHKDVSVKNSFEERTIGFL